jgi:hypothetical protein
MHYVQAPRLILADNCDNPPARYHGPATPRSSSSQTQSSRAIQALRPRVVDQLISRQRSMWIPSALQLGRTVPISFVRIRRSSAQASPIRSDSLPAARTAHGLPDAVSSRQASHAHQTSPRRWPGVTLDLRARPAGSPCRGSGRRQVTPARHSRPQDRLSD